MEHSAAIVQVVTGVSVLYVWTFRYPKIAAEFREYRYSDLFRNAIGVAKIALACLLVAGLWYPKLAFVSALAMATLMAGAQFSHAKARHAWVAFVPSLMLLLASLFVAAVRGGWIA